MNYKSGKYFTELADHQYYKGELKRSPSLMKQSLGMDPRVLVYWVFIFKFYQ